MYYMLPIMKKKKIKHICSSLLFYPWIKSKRLYTLLFNVICRIDEVNKKKPWEEPFAVYFLFLL